MKTYNYFIAYAFSTSNQSGFGNCEVIRQDPIINIASCLSIAESINADKKYASLSIISWRLFDKAGK